MTVTYVTPTAASTRPAGPVAPRAPGPPAAAAEPRFGHDFGRVQVRSSAAPLLRRACPTPPTNIAATPLTPFPCGMGSADPVSGSVVKFCRDSVELVDGQDRWVNDLVDEARFATAIEIHGNASTDGPSAAYNVTLSCMRAAAFRDLLAARGVTAPVTLMAHGPTTAYGPAPEVNRNVVLDMDLRRCGPDATDWFIRQVAAAKTDPAVLQIRRKLLEANRRVAMFGLSAERIAEGAVLQKVLEREQVAGRPPRDPEASRQIAAAAPGASELSTAKRLAVALALGEAISGRLPLFGPSSTDLIVGLMLIREAALEWAGLVGHKRRYDFKWDTGTMRRPTTPDCPTSCDNTITLCRTTLSDCYNTDVPGNIFYAHVGRFVGWSELILQLGSQYAQLSSTVPAWDPPEDTQLINASYALPDPLTSGGLCTMLAANRSIFALQPCRNCLTDTTAVIR